MNESILEILKKMDKETPATKIMIEKVEKEYKKYNEKKGFFMLNYIWAVMIAIGVIYGALTGNIEAVANGALDSAGEAVQLCITMTGIMALWVGLMEIAKNSGLIASMTKGIQPFISFLFPRIPGNHAAREYISTNIIANILGLGWACTPAGLKAMEELQKLNEEECRRTGKPPVTASNEMCTFLIMNISSLQLIPVSIIAYRSQYGSVNPTAVIVPGIIATLTSTLVAIIFVKVMDRKK